MATALLSEFSGLWRLPTALPSSKTNPVTLSGLGPLRRSHVLLNDAAIHGCVMGLHSCACLGFLCLRKSRNGEFSVSVPATPEMKRDGTEGAAQQNVRNIHKARRSRNVRCFASEGRGFGSQPAKKEKNKNEKNLKENRRSTSEPSKFVPGDPNTEIQRAPQTSSGSQNSGKAVLDQHVLEKLEAVKRSALEQKKAEENKLYQPIDYDTPVESEQKAIGLSTKVGVGVAVVVFGLVFALGDFLPYSSVAPSKNVATGGKELTKEERENLEVSLADYKATLSNSPDDPAALEGTVVTLEELGNYDEASSFLEKIIKEKPNSPDVYRLQGDVKYGLKDYDGSSSAYKKALAASDSIDFDALRGLTNSLLAAKKPSEAVQVLLTYRERVNKVDPQKTDIDQSENSNIDKNIQQIDPIQVDLLLGKAYSDWGHVSDAVAVYDQLISKYPNDFRGYLAKGIILKENGSVGDAERMFIQARFFAPEKAKVLVDRYAGK